MTMDLNSTLVQVPCPKAGEIFAPVSGAGWKLGYPVRFLIHTEGTFAAYGKFISLRRTMGLLLSLTSCDEPLCRHGQGMNTKAGDVVLTRYIAL
jgi:hypothetical protein